MFDIVIHYAAIAIIARVHAVHGADERRQECAAGRLYGGFEVIDQSRDLTLRAKIGRRGLRDVNRWDRCESSRVGGR